MHVDRGGKEKNGTPVFIAQAPYKGGIHVGKIEPGFKGKSFTCLCLAFAVLISHTGAHIAYGGDEKTVDAYRVLCYA